MRSFVRYVRLHLQLGIYPYIEDFLIAVATSLQFAKDCICISSLLRNCGFQRKEKKGCWDGCRRIEHLGSIIDTEKILFCVPKKRM